MMACRTPHVGDAVAVARALLQCEEGRRPFVLAKILREACRANWHRRETGAFHPIWGDGSLMTAALRRSVVDEPLLDNADFRRCLIAVLEALDQPRVQDKHIGTVGSRSSRAGAISSPQSVQ